MQLDTFNGFGKDMINYELKMQKFTNWMQIHFPTAFARKDFDNKLFKQFILKYKNEGLK